MSFKVTKSAQCMVCPVQPTPSGTLDLSAIDRLPGLEVMYKTFHVFDHGREPGKRIKEALGKALVHYYPFAGRLTRSAAGNDGELQVECTNKGVWFVEAVANCSLQEIGTVRTC